MKFVSPLFQGGSLEVEHSETAGDALFAAMTIATTWRYKADTTKADRTYRCDSKTLDNALTALQDVGETFPSMIAAVGRLMAHVDHDEPRLGGAMNQIGYLVQMLTQIQMDAKTAADDITFAMAEGHSLVDETVESPAGDAAESDAIKEPISFVALNAGKAKSKTEKGVLNGVNHARDLMRAMFEAYDIEDSTTLMAAATVFDDGISNAWMSMDIADFRGLCLGILAYFTPGLAELVVDDLSTHDPMLELAQIEQIDIEVRAENAAAPSQEIRPQPATDLPKVEEVIQRLTDCVTSNIEAGALLDAMYAKFDGSEDPLITGILQGLKTNTEKESTELIAFTDRMEGLLPQPEPAPAPAAAPESAAPKKAAAKPKKVAVPA